MSIVVIEDITDNIGPGDIVGAFTNEAEINAKKIGKINLKDDFAFVEIDDSVAKKVVKTMNNSQIAGEKVKIYLDDGFKDKLQQVEKYIKKFRYLVQLEREEEMKRHELEIKNLTGYERQKRGRAIIKLKGRDQGEAFGGKTSIKFMCQRQGQALPDHQISVGDLVMISRNNPLAKNNPTGTVVELSNYSITVVFDNRPNKFVYGKNLRLDLYVNDITYQRMLDSLSKLKNAKGRLKELRDKLLGLEEIKFNDRFSLELEDSCLNKSQKRAVESALAAKDLFLIHGPPGTGKTMTAIEILEQSISRYNNILATAASNIAVDNLVERLINKGIKVVRVGHPARVTTDLREHSLDYLVQEHPKYKEAVEFREEVYELIGEQKNFTHPSGRWRRGMSNQQIKKFAKQGRSNRGIAAEKIKEMAKWINLQEKIDNLFREINKLETEAIDDLINNADIVCSTNSTAGSEVLADNNFDLLLVDEATQATEPSALIPLVKANKVILLGDHKQLPPTILNQRAKEKGLDKSLFERLVEIHGSNAKEVLELQYRMNKDIMNFASQEFYNQKLVAARDIKDINIHQLELNFSEGNSPTERSLSCKEAVVFLDTKGMEAPENYKKGSSSIYNRMEAELSVETINHIISAGLDKSELAVISPYKDQVDLIKGLSKREGIEISTIDAFQGREKEIIILSLVRSNNKAKIGFLRDIRRLNVSLTRAKRKLIIIGDSSTVTVHPTYDNLIEYIKSNGYYYDL
ncbi:IGHMBP2 family helicase [Orenia marismortui]|uniref:IGHMBP2 family helicase n=1 Tax=Orenia marismortui TaxID=46469 RepID=UPI00036BAC60|nr:IGHMBP2 family helicase [Orenia marismortui]